MMDPAQRPLAEQVARDYIRRSNAVDYAGMADLFAEDAEWYPLIATPTRGAEAIRAGYLNNVRATNRPIINDRYYTAGDVCVVEFEVDLGDAGRAGIVDIFTVGKDGLIRRLAVYRR